MERAVEIGVGQSQSDISKQFVRGDSFSRLFLRGSISRAASIRTFHGFTNVVPCVRRTVADVVSFAGSPSFHGGKTDGREVFDVNQVDVFA